MSLTELRSATDRPVIIHPGFVKTATSTLQRHVFAKHPQIYFLGLPSPSPDLEWAVRHICQADTVHLEPERLHRVLANAIADVGHDKTVVISYENFALYESKDKGLVAVRLKQLFPAGRVLFTIRRQQDIIRSWYLTKLRLAIKHKGFIPFDEWYWLGAREPWQSLLDDLPYTNTVDFYRQLFGPEHVRVFLFEELVRDPAQFGSELAPFLGLDRDGLMALLNGKHENRSISRRYVIFWRLLQHLLPRKVVRKLSMRMHMREGRSASVVLSKAIAMHIAELIADDNARLARMFDLDLDRYGYITRMPSDDLSGSRPRS